MATKEVSIIAGQAAAGEQKATRAFKEIDGPLKEMGVCVSGLLR